MNKEMRVKKRLDWQRQNAEKEKHDKIFPPMYKKIEQTFQEEIIEPDRFTAQVKLEKLKAERKPINYQELR